MSLNYDKAKEIVEAAEAFEMIIETILHPMMRIRRIINLGAKDGNPGRTHQSHKEACDVNSIIRKYDNTGNLPMNSKGEGQYADVTQLQGDLTEMLDQSRKTMLAVDEALTKRDLDAKQKEVLEKQKASEEAEIKALQARLDSLKTPNQGEAEAPQASE